MAIRYKVRKGDCFYNISKKERFFWQTIWRHPENAELREKRKHPNIIKAGDRIFIPELQIKEYSCETERRHRFQIIGEPAEFTLTVLDLGEPQANEDYILTIDGKSRKGCTDENGTLREPIPSDARTGLLQIGADRREITINFGYIDPIDEISGVKTRLQNLGFYRGEVNDEVCDETIAAIAEFQRSVELSGGGELNDETKRALVEANGS